MCESENMENMIIVVVYKEVNGDDILVKFSDFEFQVKLPTLSADWPSP